MTNPLHMIDFYKSSHRDQYPEGTELVFSNWTPRGSRLEGVNEVVFFGLQYFIKEYLMNRWTADFFGKPKDEVVDAYRRRMTNAGINITYEHIEALHDLGYLPLAIRALPEGASSPIGVPQMVMWNTHPDFFWLTNYLETVMSSVLWGPSTSATIARQYRTFMDEIVAKTGGDPEFTGWMGHDFSCRGMMGQEAAMMSGAGHLLSFTGTDTVAAIDFLEDYYNADSDHELVGGSVPATEHSVMSMGGQLDEIETFRRLVTEVYPSGIVSVVSDTYDYWKVWTDYLPQLKDEIMAREGMLVIRPDSGDPVKIICGDPDAPVNTPEHFGSYELAWRLFGGETNDKGYKVLDPHIGLIYGDSITLDRAQAILSELEQQGFVPRIVFGIGSFTYQYNTRDTFGFAMKATAGVVDGQVVEIFKDPKTDSGTKKSARGLTAVVKELPWWMDSDEAAFALEDQASWEDVESSELEMVFEDGVLKRNHSLSEIRNRLHPRN